jgi:hypothetical protein
MSLQLAMAMAMPGCAAAAGGGAGSFSVRKRGESFEPSPVQIMAVRGRQERAGLRVQATGAIK